MVSSQPISHEFRETLTVTHAPRCFKVLTKSRLPDHFPVIGLPVPQGQRANLLANNTNVIAQTVEIGVENDVFLILMRTHTELSDTLMNSLNRGKML